MGCSWPLSSGYTLQFASTELRAEKKIALAAVRHLGAAVNSVAATVNQQELGYIHDHL